MVDSIMSLYSKIASPILAALLVVGVGYTNESEVAPVNIAAEEQTVPLDGVVKAEEEIDESVVAAVESARAATADDKLGEAKSSQEAIKSAAEAVEKAIETAEAKHLDMNLTRSLLLTENAREIAEAIETAQKEAKNDIVVIEEAVASWKDAVAKENARIEETRRAEEARRAAAAASYRGGGSADPSATARVSRIAATLPFSVPFVIANCPIAGSVLGCYTARQSFVVVTPIALQRSDCRIREVLAHEYRHKVQWEQGLYQIDINGNLTNRDWLEADAGAFGRQYVC